MEATFLAMPLALLLTVGLGAAGAVPALLLLPVYGLCGASLSMIFLFLPN